MSKKQIHRYETAFKVKVVLESLKEEMTINQLAEKYKVIPENIRNWKQEFLANAELVFDKEKATGKYKRQMIAQREEIDELHRINGKINAQLEWCKKKSDEFGLGL
jgi:putative transposase